jgi:NAD(P)-dependent dehydrogenase (short-subunit alcohol dehydrogenase family)
MSERALVVVITGASAGVGRATARAFARRGARLGLLARDAEGLAAATREVAELGSRSTIVEADVADSLRVRDAAEEFERTLGPIDVWINNAMASVFSPVRSMTAEEFRRVTEVTYLGYVHGTLAALERMRPRDRGVIVQIGSALAYRAIPLQSAYCAAKHAVKGFSESLRCELIHERSSVRVTMVHLPAMNTPQFGWVLSRLPRRAQPVPPIYQPETAAEAIVWAAHHAPREIKLGLPTWLAIQANKVAPGSLDRYLARTGYRSQQTDEPEDPARPHNLWLPVGGDHGAHGAFDARAGEHRLELWIATHGALLGWLVLGAVAVLATLIARG